jgi:predicted phosphoribosyltransferase
MLFENRCDAGKTLAHALTKYACRADVLLLGLPRGGVPVAFEIARELHLALDVFIVRKLGTPWQKELAMGAIASGGVTVLNDDVIEGLQIPAATVASVAREEQLELKRRELAFRGSTDAIDVRDKVVILVDDGLATGASMRAAVGAVRALHPRKVVAAVPVAARSTCVQLAQEVDEAVCLETPEPFEGVGQWYHDFSQTSDDEVRKLLAAARELEKIQLLRDL